MITILVPLEVDGILVGRHLVSQTICWLCEYGYLKVRARQQQFDAHEGVVDSGHVNLDLVPGRMFFLWLPCLLGDIRCAPVIGDAGRVLFDKHW